jgi:hypothetical protein
MQFIGGLPEHIIQRAHLEAHDVMAAARPAATLCVAEPGAALAEALEADKTAPAFAVTGPRRAGGGPGDFMGIISRARWVGWGGVGGTGLGVGVLRGR